MSRENIDNLIPSDWEITKYVRNKIGRYCINLYSEKYRTYIVYGGTNNFEQTLRQAIKETAEAKRMNKIMPSGWHVLTNIPESEIEDN